MDFETTKSAINEELRDLTERNRQKETSNLNNNFRSNNAIGGGWNSGTSIGDTQGAPLRLGFMNPRQTNPLSSTSPARPGQETTKSGIGELSRGNAPLRLTRFSGTSTTKPESDSLFSTKSIFDKKDDENKTSS